MYEYETPYSPLLNFFKSPNFMVFGWPLISIVFLVITILTSLMIGAVFISPESLFLGEMTNLEKTVLLTIRLPRILLSAIVGGGLAVAGASLQGLFRNPLADPTLIGIASGAALAVAFTIVIILPSLDVNDGVFDLYCLAYNINRFCSGALGGSTLNCTYITWRDSHDSDCECRNRHHDIHK